MDKKSIITIISVFTLLFFGLCFAADISPLSYCEGQKKFAKFRVYDHDRFANNPNSTVWTIARSPWTNFTNSLFGEIVVMDNKLTAGIEYNSTTVGRLQGEVVFTDMGETVASLNLNFYFTRGRFNGSSLILLGRNPMSQVFNRTLPIVGGTGKLFNARGYTISNTVAKGADSGVIEYNIYVEYSDVSLDCLKSLDDIQDHPFA